MNKPVPPPETEPDIFDEVDEAFEERALQESEAAYEAGRVISNEAVMRWVESWGKPDKLPPPKCGE